MLQVVSLWSECQSGFYLRILGPSLDILQSWGKCNHCSINIIMLKFLVWGSHPVPGQPPPKQAWTITKDSPTLETILFGTNVTPAPSVRNVFIFPVTLEANVSRTSDMLSLKRSRTNSHKVWVKAWKFFCEILPIYWNKPNRNTGQTILVQEMFSPLPNI